VNALTWALAGIAVGTAGVAIYAGNNLVVAVPAGSVAILCVAVLGATELRARSARLVPVRAGVARQPTSHRIESDSLIQLRRSFTAGEIGRSSILATVRALERDLSPTGRTPLSLDAERQLLDLPPDQFRQWVDDRLRRVEAAT
jgi:hypothetical protein